MKYFNSAKAMSAWILMLVVNLIAVPLTTAAQGAFGIQDDFNYPLGNLYGQGEWVRNGANTADPIQVVEKSLTYAGYNETATKCVKLGDTKSGEDLQKRFTTNDDGVLTGNTYYSALINVETAPSGNAYIMGLVLRTKSSVIADGKNGIDLGRLFISPSDNEGEVKVGIERGATKPVFATQNLKLNQTYLAVVRYEINENYPGEGLDNVYLYINPVSTTTEPETASAVIDGAKFTGSGVKSYGLQGIVLRQATTASVTAPVVYVGSLRVSDTYAGLFGAATVEKNPTLNITTKSLELGTVYTNDVFDCELTVSGTDLTGDVQVTSDSPAVTVTPATLTAADVMSGDGAKLKINVKYTDGSNSANVTLKSEGAKDVVVNITWEGYTVPEVTSLKEMREKNPDEGLVYLYTGEAVVTYVDDSGDTPVYYLQDATGALPVGDDYLALTSQNQKGDKITGIALMVQSVFGNVSGIACNTHLGKVISTGNEVEPKEITLNELKTNIAKYTSQLVKITDVTVKDLAEGTKFAVGMTQPVVTDPSGAEANIRIFKNTSLIGKDVPSGVFTLVGLSTSLAKPIIAPRGVEDIIESPELTVSPETFGTIAGVVGSSTNAATLHIKAKNLGGPVLLELSGANSDLFELSTYKIEKGVEEADVTITYKPTNVAKHKAMLTISCPNRQELAKTLVLNAYAIDEQNPPTATVTPATLEEFKAKVGESDEKTIEITTANMPDYAYIKVKEHGTFILSTTMLLRNTKNTVKVTFKPNAAGTYNNSLVISALGMTDDIEIPIVGVATDTPTTPVVEGDEFKLSTESPRTLLIEKFDNIERNKPLKLEGWTNVALEGTRAWWGFSFLDSDDSAGEKVAKVTAYDSKCEDGNETPAEMLLITPPLDFKNAASKIFTFRVRGDFLMDNQTDLLELCYIDMVDGTPYVEPVGGFSMPCKKDDSGNWFEYQVDLTGQELADVFFMGFRFTSTRGRYNSATYYIDDVSYGRTDLPAIHTSETQIEITAVPLKDAYTDVVKVTTENLTEPISLSIIGEDKNLFALSHEQLPATGGNFDVAFNSLEEGQFEALVKLSSKGAADKYVYLIASCLVANGIDDVPATTGRIAVYDINGTLVAEKANATPAEVLAPLAPGTYIVKTATADSIGTYKVKK